MTTKRGEPMVFLRLDDVTGGIDCVVFNSTYAAAVGALRSDRIVIVKGRVDHKEGETKLRRAGGVGRSSRSPLRREVRCGSTRRRAAGRDRARARASCSATSPARAPCCVDCVTSQRARSCYGSGPQLPRPAGRPTSTPRCAPCSANRRSPERLERRAARSLILRNSSRLRNR